MPLEIILPLFFCVIQYFIIHADNSASAFSRLWGSCWLIYCMSSAYGFLCSVLPDPEVALCLVPVFIIPLMLLVGFFASLENVYDFFGVFEVISVFKYDYQTSIQAQLMNSPDGFTFKGQI